MPEKNTIRVVIIDDHPLFRHGLRQAIEADPELDLVGEASDGEAALRVILEEQPDVAVVDVNLPRMSGFDVIRELQKKRCRTQIVILTMLKEEHAFNTALNLNVTGFVLKENAAAEILDCIRRVAGGEAYVSPSLTDFMLRRRSRAEHLARKQPGLEDLTMAERRVLKRVAEGKTTKEIACEFFISPRTVESHRSNICEKLGISGSNRLLQFALENREALSHLQ